MAEGSGSHSVEHSSFPNHYENSLGMDHSSKGNHHTTTTTCGSFEDGDCGDSVEGLFVAALSRDDRSTPFWVGRIVRSAVDLDTSAKKEKMVRVRWYQASGSAKDPFDAAYDPATRTPMMGGTTGDCSFWESMIGQSEIITTFSQLTSEKRLDPTTVSQIKGQLYK